MNDETNHEETTAMDKRLSAEYRSLATETVPPSVEQRVLHNAAAEVSRYSLASMLSGWLRPLAFAATAALCVAVFVDLQQTPDLELPPVADDRPVNAPPVGRRIEKDAATALSDGVRKSSQQLRRLDGAITGIRPTSPTGNCSEQRSAGAESWWQCIEELRQLGDSAAVTAENELFRAAFPDFTPAE